jgi:hypothetical protein
MYTLKAWAQVTVLILTPSLCLPIMTSAETKVVIGEATYIMGDGETPAFAEAMTLQKAKQIALA